MSAVCGAAHFAKKDSKTPLYTIFLLVCELYGLCGNQPVRRVRPGRAARNGIATPSIRRRIDGVEDGVTIQHEPAVKF